jgi:hypothetical protein
MGTKEEIAKPESCFLKLPGWRESICRSFEI